ncbi:response regulator [Methylophaga sp. SB9B]|uniref:response regulator n=1 Tax=Methylophaga sp. SB9B TaxID=2570356 RepID=UPI0010A83CFB|nr:response regulator [Methylophaga sp. SB9B]THK41225.1 response regulator [Methylophaga sp. SB9B]
MQVLLIEDDASLAQGLIRSLRHERFTVNHLSLGRQAINSIKTTPPDMVILDLGLPDMDGTLVLAEIRKLDPALPVLVLTARSSIDDRVSGLDAGADDYLAKPFDITELLARLRVFERRLSSQQHAALQIGGVALDNKTLQLQVDGQQVELSRREFMLLKILMENAGRVQTRDSLESKLYSWGEEVASNAIEVHVHHLRKKLPEGFIKTIRGVGYQITTK